MPSAIEISSYGLMLEKTRLELSAENISKMNQASRVGESPRPRSIKVNATNQSEFSSLLDRLSLGNKDISSVFRLVEGETKLVYEPKNPLSNESGFVEYPDTNHLNEMINIMKAKRAYEANISAINAAKEMFDASMNIGK